MGRISVFADEAGDFNFSTAPGASRYFILTTVTMTNFGVGAELLDLRRQLAWEGAELRPVGFHVTYDKQTVRDRVFEVLARGEIRVDATILEKRKAQPHLTKSEIAFYQLAWYMHFQYVAPKIARADDELLVVAASLGTNKRRTSFFTAVQSVVLQTSPKTAYQTHYRPAASDPCLSAADYCSWAIQRKWDRSDERSYTLIQTKVRSEFRPFRRGTVTYY